MPFYKVCFVVQDGLVDTAALVAKQLLYNRALDDACKALLKEAGVPAPHVSIHISVHRSGHMSVRRSIHRSIHIFVHMSMLHVSIHTSIHMSIHMSTIHVYIQVCNRWQPSDLTWQWQCWMNKAGQLAKADICICMSINSMCICMHINTCTDMLIGICIDVRIEICR